MYRIGVVQCDNFSCIFKTKIRSGNGQFSVKGWISSKKASSTKSLISSFPLSFFSPKAILEKEVCHGMVQVLSQWKNVMVLIRVGQLLEQDISLVESSCHQHAVLVVNIVIWNIDGRLLQYRVQIFFFILAFIQPFTWAPTSINWYNLS